MSGGKASGNQAVQYTGNDAGEGSVVVSRAMCLPAAKQARGKGKTVGLLRQGLKFSLKSGRKKKKLTLKKENKHKQKTEKAPCNTREQDCLK